MTEKPQDIADSPSLMLGGYESSDVLSDTIGAVALRGVGVSRWSPPAPFRVSVPAGAALVHLAEMPVTVCGHGMSDVALDAGDLVFLAHGGPHDVVGRTGAATAVRPLSAADMFAPNVGESAAWLTGVYQSTDEAAGLLGELPPAVVVRAAAGHAWQPLAAQLLIDEIEPHRPGAAVMIGRILDLLLIHALREWSSSGPVSSGPLAAALDSHLAPVLAAIHRHPERPWTVDQLAGPARQSRSSFAARFRAKVGTSPAAYLAQRRLLLAAELLRASSDTSAQIAHRVGYESEAAFSRAFRRQFGSPPRDYRSRATREAALG